MKMVIIYIAWMLYKACIFVYENDNLCSLSLVHIFQTGFLNFENNFDLEFTKKNSSNSLTFAKLSVDFAKRI